MAKKTSKKKSSRSQVDSRPLDPRHVQALGQVQGLIAVGDLANAESLLLRLERQMPKNAQLAQLCGVVHQNTGRLETAIQWYRTAVKLGPNEAACHFSLGNALSLAQRFKEAAAAYRQAIRLDAGLQQAYANLGIVLGSIERHKEAAAALEEAIRLAPADFQSRLNYSAILAQLGRVEAAAKALDEAMAVCQSPTAELWSEAGKRYLLMEEAGKAEQAIAKALEADPRVPEYWRQMVDALGQQHKVDAVRTAVSRLLELGGDRREELGYAIDLCNQYGLIEEAIDYYRQAEQAAPDDVRLRSAKLLNMNYLSSLSPQALFEAHRELADVLPRVREGDFSNSCEGGRKLRIGYVSADFRQHAVANFLAPVLAAHAHDRFEIHAYSNTEKPDQVTKALRACCAGWRDIRDLSDEVAIDLIRGDGIDILVDLSGHSAGNRMRLFALRGAPLQLTWLGYPNTTGVPAMDYRITDARCDPPGETEALHTEQLIRMPRVFSCFSPAPGFPKVAPPPCERNGHITFGSFNNYKKLTDEVLELWAKLLLAVDGSHLVLKAGRLKVSAVRERIQTFFEQRGIDAARVQLLPPDDSYAQHMGQYGLMDIALDAFPYCGTTTTCEALWMGVPVVTLAGNDHRSRVGVSQLSAMGLEELIAADKDGYVAIVARLAQDRPLLGELRAGMRDRFRASPLMDYEGYTRELESVYEDLWQKWCAARAGR